MPNIRNYRFCLYPNDSQEKRLQNNLAYGSLAYSKFVEYAQKRLNKLSQELWKVDPEKILEVYEAGKSQCF